MRNVLLFILLGISTTTMAQHQDIGEKPNLWRGSKKSTSDSTALVHYFKQGSFQGNIRSFSMFTQNEGELSDYAAQAVGGGIRFQTKEFYGFDAALSGFFIYNLASSDLTKRDPISNAANRYENQLFDLENPSNRNEIERMEELFLRYTFKRTSLTVGQQLINTPFINLQDGRMRLTGVRALWFESESISSIKVEGGWIFSISPRGTTRWFSVANSFGVTATGLNPDGSPSGYKENVSTEGVALLGLTYSKPSFGKIQVWETLIMNVLSTTLVQWDKNWVVNAHQRFISGVQITYQQSLGNGGNNDLSNAYAQPDLKNIVLSARLGWATMDWEYTFAVTHLGSGGRFLSPREWGREPFYTFMPRERNEGLGNTTAFVAKVGYKPKTKNWSSNWSSGYVNAPDVQETQFNKYGLPAYWQNNVDFRYRWDGFLDGLEMQVLYVHKLGIGETYYNPRFVINKVDMQHVNVIFNYYF